MKILAATDGSPAAQAAVRFAGHLAASCRSSEVILLTVGAMKGRVLGDSERAAGLSTLLRSLDEEEALEAKRILGAAAKKLHGMRIVVRQKYVSPRQAESVPQAILREAREDRADQIVAGNQGVGALKRWVLGSVAQRLISMADRPVTLVPARDGRALKTRKARAK